MIPEYYPAYVKDAGLGFPCPVIPELAQIRVLISGGWYNRWILLPKTRL